MTKEEKKYIKEVINNFVDMYKLDLNPYHKAYEIWFEKEMFREIIVDFLKKVKLSANIRLIKVKNLPKNNDGSVVYGKIYGLRFPPDGLPIPFFSEEFKNKRFLIEIHEYCYKKPSVFIHVLIHELSHLVLFSTGNKYHESEVATDLFVMCFGLPSNYILSQGIKNYISREQVTFAEKYIELKRSHIQSSGFRKLILGLLMKFL